MHTGDLGKIDEDGFVYIYGRNNNMIVLSNGKKIFPEEIETKLNTIDGVKESFVFDKDNKINAKIVYVADEFKEKAIDEIYSDITEKVKKINDSLPQYKKLSDIIITSEELEKTTLGKIKRNKEYEKINKDISKNIVNESENTTFEKIKNILISKLGNKIINEESNIVMDLGADSLDMVEIVLKVEKEFNIKIKKDERKNIAKVKDLLDIVIYCADQPMLR